MESITNRGMRRIVSSVLLTVVSAATIGSAPPDLHGQAPGGALGGVVLDDGTMGPIDAATVSIVGTNMSAVTDQRGTFVFNDPPVGRFSVRVVAADHVSVVQELELQP